MSSSKHLRIVIKGFFFHKFGYPLLQRYPIAVGLGKDKLNDLAIAPACGIMRMQWTRQRAPRDPMSSRPSFAHTCLRILDSIRTAMSKRNAQEGA